MTNFFNKDILNNNSLEYLFNDELDYLFNKDVINKDIILTFDTKIKAIYQIQDFNNSQNKALFNIDREFLSLKKLIDIIDNSYKGQLKDISDFNDIEDFILNNEVFESTNTSDDTFSYLYKEFKEPITLSFDWRVSSEAGCDYLAILLNDDTSLDNNDDVNEYADDSDDKSISGNTDWEHKVFENVTKVKFVYTKDGSDSENDDKGYIKNINYISPTSNILYIYENGLKSIYNINRKFNNKNNFAFYKLGIIQIPPKRIIVKGFDD